MPSEARTKFLTLARKRFKQAQEAEKAQRKREKDDLAFYAGDQWPEDIKKMRQGQQGGQGGLPPVPARPTITINKTREPIRQVLNEERQSELGIELVPADDFGDLVGPIDDTEIQLREGLTRRIQRDSKANDARTWAFARATIAGRGFYGVMTRYVPGKTNDQEVYVHRYYDQSCVLIDPAHEQPDGSDAEWSFVATDMSWDAYIAEYPKRKGKKNDVCDATESEWQELGRGLGDDRPLWFIGEGDTRMMRVVEYRYTVRESRELVTLENAAKEQRAEWVDEVDAEDGLLRGQLIAEGWAEVEDSRRTVVEKKIKWAKIDGCDDDALDETDWPGPDMPIVKVLGEELQPYDAERRAEGMVRPMREPGYGFNVMVSRWIEQIGLSSLVPAMVVEGTIEGYEAWWEAANTRTLPYLPYKLRDLEGNPAPPPTVVPSREPPISAIAASVQMFDQAIQSTSGIHAPALGEGDPSVRSNRHAQSLIDQSAASSSHYLNNLQRSIEYEAQIINNLLYPIYGRPGRIARIVNGEGDVEHVLLHTPMVMQGRKPMPAQPGQEGAKTYTLTKDAKFNIAITVSPQKDTRRMQEAETIGQLMAKNPELMTWFGDLFFHNLDGPGHQQMADRAKVMLAPPIQQMLAAKQQGQDPQSAAQLGQAQQQIQQLQAELQKAQKPTAVEEIKQQGLNERTAAELAADAQKTRADNETKIAVAELGAKVDRLALFLEERARLGVQAHDVGMAAMQHAHATDARQSEQEHAAEMQAEQQHAAREQAETAARQQQEGEA